ncbi:MAG TPA: BMP family ABC transporter substrate-binding protein, partial [Azospirillaceae bacterium]|nr:BMP family ABC transporter substrate-binding protein [Azospirillaceae bacterium]
MEGSIGVKKALRGTGLALLALLAAGPSMAAEKSAFVPAVIYAIGQKFDKSFNEAAFDGAQRFERESGVKVLETEPANVTQFEQAVSSLVRRGATDIAAVGFYYATPLNDVAPKFPGVRFTLVDSRVDQPNVQSIVFKEHEGSFLVGMMAGMVSKTGRIGFVGALDIPLLRKFSTAYGEGARHVNPNAEVLLSFISATPAGFNDPTKGAEVARSQF